MKIYRTNRNHMYADVPDFFEAKFLFIQTENELRIELFKNSKDLRAYRMFSAAQAV